MPAQNLPPPPTSPDSSTRGSNLRDHPPPKVPTRLTPLFRLFRGPQFPPPRNFPSTPTRPVGTDGRTVSVSPPDPPPYVLWGGVSLLLGARRGGDPRISPCADIATTNYASPTFLQPSTSLRHET